MTSPNLVRILATIIFWAACQGSVRGDGLLQQLPKDGAWAKFRMTNRLFGPSARNSEREGELRISCVGAVHENGRECRWIEIRDENRHLDGRIAYVYITKFLVPEETLERGHPGHTDILRAWRKKGNNDAELILEPIESGMTFGIYFPGATTDTNSPESLEQRTFVVNGNKIRSESAIQQQAEFDTVSYRHVLGFRLWKHAVAPFGVAGARIESQAFSRDHLDWTFLRNYELVEWGDGATSELPNNN